MRITREKLKRWVHNFNFDSFANQLFPMSAEKENTKFEIPKSGSLGLLALGYRGLVAWRKVRDAENEDHLTTQKGN